MSMLRLTLCRAVLPMLALALSACTAPRVATDETVVARLVDAMQGKRFVLLGEVHDNPTQHALRVAALRRLVAGGARPAFAFEQFDRERQPDIDRARGERPRDADHLIASARPPGDGWDWSQYRPFVQLALDHDLPVVAANLSRADAMRVARNGFGAVFDAERRSALGLDAMPADFLHAHEQAIHVGHCGLMPPKMLPTIARAQIARDVVLAQSIRAHADTGVVLLTGNGHVRNDIGVPFWLTDAERRKTVSIALLEHHADRAAGTDLPFDASFFTPPAEREDPCSALRQQSRKFAPPYAHAAGSPPPGGIAMPQ
jgi:uncharacterized iron-regulated protein